MKNLILSASAIAIIAFSGCDKHDEEAKIITLNATLKQGEIYTLDVKSYGDADDNYTAIISAQASNFSKSEVTENTKFSYTPAANFTGSDKVVISLNELEHRNGKHHSNAQTTEPNDVANEHPTCNKGANKPHHERTETEAIVTINFNVISTE